MCQPRAKFIAKFKKTTIKGLKSGGLNIPDIKMCMLAHMDTKIKYIKP